MSIDQLEAFLTALVSSVVGSGWLYPAMLLILAIDGVLPFLPVEASVIMVMSWSHSTDAPPLAALLIMAFAGATAGDNLAYLIGRQLSRRRPRSVRLQRLRLRVGDQFDQRGATTVLAARFIPVGRVAATMAAGASGFRWGAFAMISLLASALWVGWVTLLGYVGTLWFDDRPLVASVVGVLVRLLVGVAVDRGFAMFGRRSASPDHPQLDSPPGI